MSAILREVDVALFRGGSSKGVFVNERDLPPPGPTRDAAILRLMGSPDPMQLDGLGGTHSSTSKLVAMSPGVGAEFDAAYLFAQIAVEQAVVDYTGNCGNLTAAAALWAAEAAGFAEDGVARTVRLFNANTGRRVDAEVALAEPAPPPAGGDGPAYRGRTVEVRAAFLQPAGAVTGELLPTGQVREVLHTPDGAPFEVSIMDVSGVACFVRASDLGVPATARPHAINGDRDLLARFEALRQAAGRRLGRVSPGSPRLVLGASPHDHERADGAPARSDPHDLIVRAMSMQRMHHACPFTVLQCAAAAALTPGSIVADVARVRDASAVRAAHPKGVAEARVRVGAENALAAIEVVRTARRLLEGRAFLA